MNWTDALSRVLAQAPTIVQRVETTAAAASGQDKKTMATDWLIFAAQMAAACAPEHAGLVQAVAMAGGAVIDATVAIANATGGLKHKGAQDVPGAA